MKLISKTLAVAIIAATPILGTTVASQAGQGISAETTRINHEGFHRCKLLRGRGYKASVAGISDAGLSSAGFAKFRVNTCFETRTQCFHFLDRIHHHITSIDRIHHAKCFEH